MESCVEKLEGLAHKLTIEIPAEKIDRAVAERLRELRPRIRIDGFRRGKVPPHLLKRRYGANARQDVLGKEIDDGYRTVIENSDYSPVAQPEIELISGVKEGEALKFTAVFEVLPEVQVKGLDALAITLPKTQITEQDIDEMLETLRLQHATFSETDEAARAKDRVTVDFVGEIGGTPFTGGSGENMEILIGEGKVLPDFEDHLKGMKVGEKKAFDTRFPADYQDGELAGKTARFSVTIKKVERMNLPELDERFIKGFGIETGDIAAFRKSIHENMTRELENANRRIRRERLFNAILEHNDDQIVPQASLSQETERMAKKLRLDEQIADKEKRQSLIQKLCAAPAKRRLQLGFLLGKLFEERAIELDRERVDARLENIASTYEDPAEVRKWYRNDRKAKTDLESAVLEEQLIDQLYATATVTEEEKTFQEVMALDSRIRN